MVALAASVGAVGCWFGEAAQSCLQAGRAVQLQWIEGHTWSGTADLPAG
jgi:hypothetical protein